MGIPEKQGFSISRTRELQTHEGDHVMKTGIEKYLGQPSRIEAKLIDKVSESIQLYAFWDIDKEMKFTEGWVVLGANHLWVFKLGELLKKISLENIHDVKEFQSINASGFECLDDRGEVLTSILYTHRQKLMFAQIIYLLREKIKGNDHEVETDIHEYYQKSVLKNIDKEQKLTEGEKQSVVTRLVSYIKPYKVHMIIGGLAAVIASLVSLGPAYLSGRLIDRVIKIYQAGELTLESALSESWMLLGILGSCYVLRELFAWIRLKRMSLIGEWVASDLRKDLYSHLQSMDMEFFGRRQTGSLISRVSSDTDRIWDFIAFGIVEVGIALVTLLGLSGMLISLDVKLGLLMTIPVPLVIYSIYRHGKHMEKLFLRCWRKWSDLTDVLSDTIPGVQVVKAFYQQGREIKRFNNKNDIALEEFEGVHLVWTKFWPKMMLTIHFMVLLVWFFAIPRLLSEPSDEVYLTAGTFVSFLLYMTMFKQPIEIIGQMARMLNRATSSAFRIFEILDTHSTMKIDENAKQIQVEGHIEFKDVIFSYDGIRQILKGINFEINSGEMIGLVGSSGGGKSTITKLLMRFYDVKSGSITIDGTELKDIELGSYRSQVGMVLQDPFLFHGTIRDNITYGLPGATEKEIIEAARVANAHEFIMKLPEGYHTMVGERGQSLSGGRSRESQSREPFCMIQRF